MIIKTNAKTAPVIDYDTATLEQMRVQFASICKVVCLQMTEDGVWPAKESTPKVSFMPQPSKDDEEQKGPGLPFPRRLGDHISEMWSRTTVKGPTALKTCLTWPEHFKRFCQLTSMPSAKELALFNLTEEEYKKRLKAHGLKESTEIQNQILQGALNTIRAQASIQALAQADYDLLVKTHKSMSELMEAQAPTSSGFKKLDGMRDNLAGLQLAAWAKHTLAFAAADAAARTVHGAIHAIRKDACVVLMGPKCAKEITEKLITLPILNGTLFGTQLETQFGQMAKNQTTRDLVSKALQDMGQQGLPSAKGSKGKKPFQGKPRDSAHTKGRFSAAQAESSAASKAKGNKGNAPKSHGQGGKSSSSKGGKGRRGKRSGGKSGQGKSQGKSSK